MLTNFDNRLKSELVRDNGFKEDEFDEIMKCLNYHCNTKSKKSHYALNSEDLKAECLPVVIQKYDESRNWKRDKRVNGLKKIIKNKIGKRIQFFNFKKRSAEVVGLEFLGFSECISGGQVLDAKMKELDRLVRLNCSHKAELLFNLTQKGDCRLTRDGRAVLRSFIEGLDMSWYEMKKSIAELRNAFEKVFGIN